jgi:hypothetical protein
LKLWIILAICSFSCGVLARAPGTYFQVRSELQKISQKNLVEFVNQLVQTSAPSRMVGMPGHEKARDYILESIKKSDPKNAGKTTVVTFSPDIQEAKRFYQNDFDQKVVGKISKLHPDFQRWLKFTSYIKNEAEKLKDTSGENLIWEKNGLNPNKILVITAHYDTISFDQQTFTIQSKDPMPGANYNASGVAVALSLIKVLSSIDLNYTVQVVFLDWQGIAYLGSFQEAKELKALSKTGKSILGVINLEMLGQDTSFFDKTKKTGNMSVYLRQNPQEIKWVESLVQHGSKVTDKVSFEIKPNNFESSDTFRFWEQDLIAATFSQNWEDDFNPKFYQTTQDTPETLNHQTLYYAYQYLGGAVLGTLLDITK